MRIVPNQRQQSDDDIGSDRDAQRVRRDHLTKLKAMLRQRQLPIPTGDKKGAPPGVEARQVNSDIEDLADPFRTLKDCWIYLITWTGLPDVADREPWPPRATILALRQRGSLLAEGLVGGPRRSRPGGPPVGRLAGSRQLSTHHTTHRLSVSRDRKLSI